MRSPRQTARLLTLVALAGAGWVGFGAAPQREEPPASENPSEATPDRDTPDADRQDPPADPTEVPTEAPTEVVVHLLGGTSVSGLLVSSGPGRTVIRVNGSERAFPASQIDHLETLPPILDRYRALRATIDPQNANQRLLLAEWLRDRELYQLALDESTVAERLDPGNPAGAQLTRWLRFQIRLEEESAIARAREPIVLPTPPERVESFPVLNDAEMNLIRVYEVNLRNPPKLRALPGLVDAMFENYAEHPAMPTSPEGRELLRQARVEDLLGLLFRMRARELYPMIEVLGEPDSLARFRRDIHRGWLINACASNDCHGGVDAGRLQLRTRRANSDETMLTNFLILDRFKLDDGTPLINTEQPVRSPLLQFGLREGVSTRPHPEIERRGRVVRPDPVFRSTNDLQFREAVGWIHSLYQPRPDYPIEYPRKPEGETGDGSGDENPFDRSEGPERGSRSGVGG